MMQVANINHNKDALAFVRKIIYEKISGAV